MKKILLIVLAMLALYVSVVFSVCNTDQLIGAPCYENVHLNSNCTYVDVYDSENVFYDKYILTYDYGEYYFNYSLNIKTPGTYRLNFCDGITYAYIRMISNETGLSDYSGNNVGLTYMDSNMSNERLMTLILLIVIWLGCAFIGFQFGQSLFLILSSLIGIVLGLLLFAWIYWWVGIAVIFINIGFLIFSSTKAR